MSAMETIYPESIESTLIAPCGMDCGVCIGHLREKNRCAGCSSDGANKVKHCQSCRIRNCDEGGTLGASREFCFECATFPCTRLKHLDARYRKKYGMSMAENLETIHALGVDGFVAMERQRWKCPGCGGVLCVHREACIYCGRARAAAMPANAKGARSGTES